MTEAFTYGQKVVEFFKHDDAELQTLLDKEISLYNGRSEGLHYKGMAAHVDWVRHKPLELSLIELQDEWKKGFTIVKATSQALYLHVILRKPEKIIKAELADLSKTVTANYEKDRYERNVAETARQMEITIFAKRRREEAAAAAEAAAARAVQQADEEASALADLLRAYATPAATEQGAAA